MRPLRICFLHEGMMAYQDVCQRALADLGDELLTVYPGSMPDTAFDDSGFVDYGQKLVWHDEPPAADDLLRLVDEFNPDAVMMRAWRSDVYRKVLKARAGKSLRIMFSSNIWLNAPRQWVGRATHRWYLRPWYDCAYVPGERSEFFVRRLGFGGEDIIRGADSADVATFLSPPRTGTELASERRFVFSGRLVWHKAIDTLTEAYREYRDRVEDPWALSVAGTGPLLKDFDGIPGVEQHGFLQPADLAALMHRSSCLLFPSHVDFWGVIVHEGGSAGLPMICSDGVGAVPYLLQDGFNGWVTPAGNASALAGLMVRMTEAGPERLQQMSDGSRALSSRLTPEIWARHLHEEIEARLPAALRGERWRG